MTATPSRLEMPSYAHLSPLLVQGTSKINSFHNLYKDLWEDSCEEVNKDCVPFIILETVYFCKTGINKND